MESYKTLTPSPENTTVILLTQISQQLAVMTNSSSSTVSFVPSDFTSEVFVPTTSALVCNTLWFLSLGFSLACALSATLVEQWVRNYLQATESRPTPHERARLCAYLFKGLEKFKMSAVVEAIPMLLHISLLLFFAGLVEFLRPVNAVMSALTLGILVLCVALYALATIIPAFHRDCPYQTPLSGTWWKLLKMLRLLRRLDPQGNTALISGSMAQARETDAFEISPERDQRDLSAMSWTLKTLREDGELEAFVEVIPRVVAGFDYSAKLLLHKLLHHHDISVRLGHRIPRLLISCTGGVLDPTVAQRRATTCLAAIWSLNMMSVHTDSSQPSAPVLSRDTLRFDEFTLRDMQAVKNDIPGVAEYATSAMAVVTRSLLDMHIEQMVTREYELVEFLRTQDKELMPRIPGADIRRGRPEHVFKRIQHILDILARHLDSGDGVALSLPFVLITALYQDISTLLIILGAPSPEIDVVGLASETLEAVRQFRALLNQAGFSLTMDYAANLLSSRQLPYEAFNTVRRIFLRIDFSLDIPVKSQRQFVACLDEALESDADGATRIPQSIINIMLGLTRALDDPTCVLKAKSIIGRCMRFLPSPGEAQKALSVLDSALPEPAPILDLFTSHMYANIKLDKGTAQLATRDPVIVANIANVPMPRRKYETA